MIAADDWIVGGVIAIESLSGFAGRQSFALASSQSIISFGKWGLRNLLGDFFSQSFDHREEAITTLRAKVLV